MQKALKTVESEESVFPCRTPEPQVSLVFGRKRAPDDHFAQVSAFGPEKPANSSQVTHVTAGQLALALTGGEHAASSNNAAAIQSLDLDDRVTAELASKLDSSGNRDYISYMLSIQIPRDLPTSHLPQHIYKVDYDMNRFTEVYSLKNNYTWNYHMPLLLPDLLHYLNNKDQLQDYQYKAITTIIHKSIHYYGFTPLTMTNLTPAQRLQINNYLIDYKLSLTMIDYTVRQTTTPISPLTTSAQSPAG